MSSSNGRCAAIVVCLTLLLQAPTAAAEDWEQEGGGPTRNARVGTAAMLAPKEWAQPVGYGFSSLAPSPILVGSAIVVTFPSLKSFDAATGVLNWEVPAVNGAIAEPATNGEHIFIPSDDEGGKIVAAELATGRIIWEVELGRSVRGGIVLSGNRLFVSQLGEQHDAGGRVTALSSLDGSVLWTRNIPVPATGGLSLHQGLVFVPEASGTLRALSLEDGNDVWTWDATGPMGPPPLVYDGALFQRSFRNLSKLSLVGQHLLTVSLPARSTTNLAGTGSLVLAGTWAVEGEGRVTAYHADDLRIIWEGRTAGDVVETAATIGQDALVADSHGVVYRFDALTGESKGSIRLGSAIHSRITTDGSFGWALVVEEPGGAIVLRCFLLPTAITPQETPSGSTVTLLSLGLAVLLQWLIRARRR